MAGLKIRGLPEYAALVDGAERSLETSENARRHVESALDSGTVPDWRLREYRRDLVNLKREQVAVQQRLLTWRAEILSDSLRASGDERETLQGLIDRIDAIVLDDAA